MNLCGRLRYVGNKTQLYSKLEKVVQDSGRTRPVGIIVLTVSCWLLQYLATMRQLMKAHYSVSGALFNFNSLINLIGPSIKRHYT